jgi:hypothetical protein
MKLYELTENYKNLQELMENPDIPQDVILEALNSIEGDIFLKLENIVKLLRSIEADVKIIKEEKQRLAAKQSSLENRCVNLKSYIEGTLKALGKDKVKSGLFTLSIAKNPPSVNVVDLKAIPKEYIKQIEPEVMRTSILKELKQGREIPGVELIQTEGLRIR